MYMTDIQEYLNSLPANTDSIDLSNKGLTELPDLSRFTQLHLFSFQTPIFHKSVTFVKNL